MEPDPINKAFNFHCNSGHGVLLTILRKGEGKVHSIILFKERKCFKNKKRSDRKGIDFVLFLCLIRWPKY